jgi:5'-methylthioadenosine phosphorylase
MIGIIGGSGLYRIEGLNDTESCEIDTPFGNPSAQIVVGSLAGQRVAFLARHGQHHERLPSEINFRANILALKSIGVRTIVGVSAVGSLREDLRPGDLVLPSQYIDFTKGMRAASFFGGGLIAHVSTAQPTCAKTAELIASVARKHSATIHIGKTYACVEGPRLGTRAESYLLRNLGADVVGMTNVPEAFLACEAQICYSTIALVTDYDCWMDDPSQHVTAERAIGLYTASLARVQGILKSFTEEYVDDDQRPCRRSLAGAVLTPEDRMTPAQRELLALLRR